VSDRNSRLCALFQGLATRIHSADLRTLGFTGAVFGEGASTLALGTSVSLAALEPGPILLVDANWLRPSLTSDAGVASSPGLADVLRGDVDLGEAIVSTGRPRLSFLAAGAVKGAQPPLGRLAPLLDQARSQFSTVVADLPPALAGDDVVVPWANALEQLFVVVRSGVTPLNIVRRALDQVALEEPQVVLNGLSMQTAATTVLPSAAVL
jgi:Mrp family chromosome partitioning ATPase